MELGRASNRGSSIRHAAHELTRFFIADGQVRHLKPAPPGLPLRERQAAGTPHDLTYARVAEDVSVCCSRIAAASRRPKAILCQKPIAVDLAEADAMLTACERNGVKLIMAYQRPHHAAWLAARDLIRQAPLVVCNRFKWTMGATCSTRTRTTYAMRCFFLASPGSSGSWGLLGGSPMAWSAASQQRTLALDWSG